MLTPPPSLSATSRSKGVPDAELQQHHDPDDRDKQRRLSRLSRRMKLHKFERHAVQRRSMPEIQKANLIYVNGYGGRRAMEYRSHEDGLNDWKPRTDFERSYFGNDNFHDDQTSSGLNYYECNDHRLLKDQNSNLVAFEPKEDPIDPAEIPRRIDDYVVPHSPEFRTSRDRLHEIFEHNRYLRRKFFSDLPGSTQKLSSSKFRNYPVSKTLGFGSTETLTSQSNGSSTDGRKSRAEFGNTPDSLDQKVAANPPLPLTYFGTDRDGGTWRSITRRPNDDSISQRLRSLLNNSENNMAMRNPEFRKSLPNLNDSIARLSVDGLSVKLKSQEEEEDAKAENKDKYFASYAHVTDSSDESNGRSRRYASCDDLEPFSESWRKSRSLLELSTSRGESRVERMIRRRGSHSAFKSCSDLELLSPTLVLSASRERILTEEQEEDEEDNSGSTPPSVYGPIPYKSPRRYVEGEVTIHYRSPVRAEAKESLSEEELARRSAENMRRVYQEERRRKYLQELHDIDSRRHTDNFIPSQKSPIPLNRYDDFVDDLSYRSRSQEQTPEPRLVARALYNFVGQTPRELTFRRNDLIFVRRQVDKNWYEGEHNAMVGLFPFNYVEIIPYDEVRTLQKKPYEGQARAKFNFVAQTTLELSLVKGELVYLTRRVDENWWEGRVGNKKGIFPVSYVEVLCEPGHRPETPVQSKPVASPAAHSMLSNGSASGKLSMGSHHYSPSLPVNINATQPHYNSLPKGGTKVNMSSLNEALHIDTHSEPIPYRALYNYRPQNEDELELHEGDTVYVMEKCDDGWYVGSSQRTGYFGTFPGNYVERL